jgi:AcrR family transcriptional regulator
VLEAAVAWADEHGTDGLSMRVLAGELGCGAMSLYNHVAHKHDMLEGMVDRVAAEIASPHAEDGDWKAALRTTAHSAHDTLLRHPWAAPLWSKSGPGPARLRHMDGILRILREADFSVAAACRGFHAITTHILGFTLQRLDFPVARQDLARVAADFLREMPTEEFPWFAEHVRHHIDTPDQGDSFSFVLDLILEGLERETR